MKKYLAVRMRFTAFIMAAALGTFAFVGPQYAVAQSAPEKIRLMAETLRARDSGNLMLAKDKAEELIRLAPDDENVQRLLISINDELDRREAGQALYGQTAEPTTQAAPVADAPPAAAAPARSGTDDIAARVAAEQQAKIEAAEIAIAESKKLAELGAYSDANSLLDAASASLTLNVATARTLDRIEDAKAAVVLEEVRGLEAAGDYRAAERRLSDYRAAGGSERTAHRVAARLNAAISNPYDLSIGDVSPEYVRQAEVVRDLLTRARAQYLNGDYDGASATFKEVEARDANNAEAKLFQERIAERLSSIHAQNQRKTRAQMLTEVDQSWERPKVFDITDRPVIAGPGNQIQAKMNEIIIPQVNFSGMELTRVIETLSELSVEYDPERVGVNVVPLFNPNENNPRVNISLRNLSLDRILQFVTQQVNFSYDVGSDAVTVAPSFGPEGGGANVTEFFPITRATRIRLTGFRDGGGGGRAQADPFAAPAPRGGGGGDADEETAALRSFFQRAGVNFDIPGANLAFDGEQLIVTQSRRNLERLRTILRNYNEVKQVEIEAKFLEVAQNDLEEVGFDWTVANGGNQRVFEFGGRRLSDTFSVEGDTSNIAISRPASTERDAFGSVISETAELDRRIGVFPPTLPTNIDLAAGVGALFDATGWSVNGYNVDFAIRALARKSGSDLMSAPKITVLSGKRANITVAQELRYPESYGDIESTVSAGGSQTAAGGGGGGAAISITAASPRDFVTRNVGVELSVTPNVENDDTISLILEPRVTEFEGFVEYGGPSVALVQDTTVTVPAGFFQPVFSTREISTEVTVFDGATIVMGGLTRDEVKYVSDKVPVLGDIPGLGRLFRSEGETRQKRNLLIFVTANLVSPGGSPARQNYRNVNANSLFQNPTIMTPSGVVNRTIENPAAD